MLNDLKDKLLSENKQYTPHNIWANYKILDSRGNVEDYDTQHNSNALTHYIQISKYAYKKSEKLCSLHSGYASRFNLYCGSSKRVLSDEQTNVMREIAEYVVNEGSITPMELHSFEPDLWKKAITSFKADLSAEMITLSKFMLRA